MPGISGRNLSSIKHPANTILIAEAPAFIPYSWHDPKRPIANPKSCFFNNAMDIVSFADRHVSYIKIYFDGKKIAPLLTPMAQEWLATFPASKKKPVRCMSITCSMGLRRLFPMNGCSGIAQRWTARQG